MGISCTIIGSDAERFRSIYGSVRQEKRTACRDRGSQYCFEDCQGYGCPEEIVDVRSVKLPIPDRDSPTLNRIDFGDDNIVIFSCSETWSAVENFLKSEGFSEFSIG